MREQQSAASKERITEKHPYTPSRITMPEYLVGKATDYLWYLELKGVATRVGPRIRRGSTCTWQTKGEPQ
jgi:hypothetical protein